MNFKLTIACSLLFLSSCTKVEKTVQMDSEIYGTYIGQTRLYGIGTPRHYDTTVEQTFVVEPRGDDFIWIENMGLFGMSSGMRVKINAEHVYFSGCDSAECYSIHPAAQEFHAKTMFTAGMGGMIHTEFVGKKVNQ